MKKLYMAVTGDRLELPIAVEEKPQDLAKKFGISSDGLLSMISNCKKYTGRKSRIKYIKVMVEDDE